MYMQTDIGLKPINLAFEDFESVGGIDAVVSVLYYITHPTQLENFGIRKELKSHNGRVSWGWDQQNCWWWRFSNLTRTINMLMPFNRLISTADNILYCTVLYHPPNPRILKTRKGIKAHTGRSKSTRSLGNRARMDVWSCTARSQSKKYEPIDTLCVIKTNAKRLLSPNAMQSKQSICSFSSPIYPSTTSDRYAQLIVWYVHPIQSNPIQTFKPKTSLPTV